MGTQTASNSDSDTASVDEDLSLEEDSSCSSDTHSSSSRHSSVSSLHRDLLDAHEALLRLPKKQRKTSPERQHIDQLEKRLAAMELEQEVDVDCSAGEEAAGEEADG